MKDRVGIVDAPLQAPDFDIADFTGLTRVATLHPPPPPGGGGGPPGPPQPSAYLPAESKYLSLVFPWMLMRNALAPDKFVWAPSSGAAAGTYARVDSERGVHKAPANERMRGALDLRYKLTQQEQEDLNVNGVNVIRFFGPRGPILWGARMRTLDLEYVPVRRTLIMLEESIARGTQWVVFEPNDQTLWKSICRDASEFLMRMWRNGMLMGATPQEAFFVKCDAETNPMENVNAGIVTTEIGVCLVKPAEFVVFKIGQWSGGTQKEAV
jgi:phage tail sheath protein FI